MLAVAFAAFVTLGMVDGALGVAWPSISRAFDRSISDLGVLLVAGGAGYLMVSLTYGWLHDRLGTGILLAVGSGLMALGIVGLASGTSWPVMVGAPLVLGLGGGLVDTGMNAHAALQFDVRAINLLHACFGVGATLGPIVITISLTTSGAWRAGYWFLAAAQLVVGVAIWIRRKHWVASGGEVAEPAAIRRRRRSALLILLFLLYTGVEVGAGQWAFTLLSEGRGLSTAAAGAWVAAYWGGLTVGRLAVGLVGGRWTPSATLHGSLVVALFGLGVLWLDPGGWGALGLPVAGAGLAPIFPTMVSITPQRIGRDRSTHSIGFQLAAATLGASTIPWIVGIVAAQAGLESLAASLFVAALLLAIVMVASEREARIGVS